MDQPNTPLGADDWFRIICDSWEQILSYLKKPEFDIAKVSHDIWISPLLPEKLVKNKEGKFVLSVLVPDEESEENHDPLKPTLPGKVYQATLEKKYMSYIQVAVQEITGLQCLLEFVVREKKKQKEEEVKPDKGPSSSVSPEILSAANLFPDYTFENFVVGKNNNMAHAASLAVAERPGQAYNPLFLYGGVGLGKTHLMQSIAHFVLKSNPKANVLYVTSEVFTNELIDAIQMKNNVSVADFRDKYRNIDVLLIDDIQFIGGKDRTQEEFFHTFNTLYSDSKQIIISSDKPPKELVNLEARLISRFTEGLTVDIQPPDYETRVAILRKKEEREHINFDNEIIQYIASNIKSNIRELEGALTKLVAGQKLGNQEITLPMAQEVLKDYIDPSATVEMTPDVILQVVAEHFSLTVSDLTGQKRNKEIVYPRQLAMYLCRELTQTPLQTIGQVLGGRDHSTVIHGLDKISTEIRTKPDTERLISVLKKKLSSR